MEVLKGWILKHRDEVNEKMEVLNGGSWVLKVDLDVMGINYCQIK